MPSKPRGDVPGNSHARFEVSNSRYDTFKNRNQESDHQEQAEKDLCYGCISPYEITQGTHKIAHLVDKLYCDLFLNATCQNACVLHDIFKAHMLLSYIRMVEQSEVGSQEVLVCRKVRFNATTASLLLLQCLEIQARLGVRSIWM